MASDTKKNKGVSKKEKHKNEEKIDPNDLVVKLTGKQKIYPVKGRRENAIPQTGKVCLPVVGVKNIKKRPTTDHLLHIKEKAKSVGGTKVMSVGGTKVMSVGGTKVMSVGGTKAKSVGEQR